MPIGMRYGDPKVNSGAYTGQRTGTGETRTGAPDPGKGNAYQAAPVKATPRGAGVGQPSTMPGAPTTDWATGKLIDNTSGRYTGFGNDVSSQKGEGLLSGPGYYEEFYKTHGGDLMGGPSSSEQLYSQGVDALNPYYDYAQKQAIKSINDAAAARGGFNSSHTMTNIGNTVANLRGQQAKEMAQLAQQSDQAKFARYDRSADMAGDAQRAMENRAVTAGNAYTNLADKQAGQVRGFYGDATRGMTDTNMAAIELQLKEAGLNQEQAKQVMDMWTSLGGLAAKS